MFSPVPVKSEDFEYFCPDNQYLKMRKLTFCILFSLVAITGFSQKVYFVYLQAEGEQSFYVKIGDKIHSSSASGYLILSKLLDSTYNFTVGFPRNKWPEHPFSVTINKKDHGYLLKNFGEKGWGLFDLQTLSVQMPVQGSAMIEEKKMEGNNVVSVFTEILSKASDDPSLKEKPGQTIPEIKKTEVVTAEVLTLVNEKELPKDSLVSKPVELIEKPSIVKEEIKMEKPGQPVVSTEEIAAPVTAEYKPSVVIKKSESSTTEGFGLVFIDDSGNGQNDTIRLLIPNSKTVLPVIKEEPDDEKKFIDLLPDTVKKKDEASPEMASGIKETPVEKTVLKKNCISVADETDFFNLRKNMAAAMGDSNMLVAAGDYFKAKCFSTMQVRNLSLLFLNDEARYKFFELSFPYVTDPEKFSDLQNELKEEYYISRFKSILNK